MAYKDLDEVLRRAIGQTDCLYQQVDFLEAVAPGKSWLACLSEGEQTWYFPFTGEKWLWKWRVFRVSFCPYFMPFGPEPIPQQVWMAWFDFLLYSTWQQDWCFQLPAGMEAPKALNSRFGIFPKTNLVLDLNPGFEAIYQQWKANRKAAWKKRNSVQVQLLDPSEFNGALQRLAQKGRKGWFPDTKQQANLNRLIKANALFHIDCWAALSDQEVLSLVLLVHFRDRIHYLFSVSSMAGFKAESLTALLGTVFQQNQGCFDFEGSSLPGVKAFFQSFGAIEQPYFCIKKGP